MFRRNSTLGIYLPLLASLACSGSKTSTTTPKPSESPPSVHGAGADSGTNAAANNDDPAAKWLPAGVPKRLTPAIPRSLQAPKLSLSDSSSQAAATLDAARGVSTVYAMFDSMLPAIIDLTKNLYLLYANLAIFESNCSVKEGPDWQSCTLGNHKLSMNPEILDAVYAALGGKEQITDSSLETLGATSNTTITVAQVSLARGQAVGTGYATCVTLRWDDLNRSQYCWTPDNPQTPNDNEAQAAVTDTYERESLDEGSISKQHGVYHLTYLASNNRLQMIHEGSDNYMGSKLIDRFTIEPNPDNTLEPAVVFALSTKRNDPKYGRTRIRLHGLADNYGGYVATHYGWDDVNLSSLLLNEVGLDGTTYILLPKDKPTPATEQGTPWSDAWGYFVGNGTKTGVSHLAFWGPKSPLPPHRIVQVGVNSDLAAEIYSDTLLQVSSWNLGQVTNRLYFEEEFDADRGVTYSCGRSLADDSCAVTSGKSGLAAAAYDIAQSREDPTLAGRPKLTLSGDLANTETFAGDDIYLYRNQVTSDDLKAQNLTDNALLAVGIYFDTAQSLSPTDMRGYDFHVLTTDTAALAAARIFTRSLDEDGISTWREVPPTSGIVITLE